MNEELKKYKIAVVAPVHIKLTDEWIASLKAVTKDCTVIIVDDSDGKVELPAEWDVYGYARQEAELGELYKDFKQFHKSSACRNFGHWIAYKQGFDIIIALDSDCIVGPDFISKHVEELSCNSYGWVNTIKNTSWFPRGYPYFERMRPTVMNIGLWEHELDINGRDRVKRGQPPAGPMIDKQEIAHGILPLCGMNVAMWSYAVPGFLFLPNIDMGEVKIRRYDDIWGGYIFQKLMQKTNDLIRYGYPIVYHDTIVDADADAELEEDGIRLEASFYNIVDTVCADINPDTYANMFKELASFGIWKQSPFKKYLPGFELWVKMFDDKKYEKN
jgi:hypothetical protein